MYSGITSFAQALTPTGGSGPPSGPSTATAGSIDMEVRNATDTDTSMMGFDDLTPQPRGSYVDFECQNNPFLKQLQSSGFISQRVGVPLDNNGDVVAGYAFLVPPSVTLDEHGITNVTSVFAQHHTIKFDHQLGAVDFTTLAGMKGHFADMLDKVTLVSTSWGTERSYDVLRQITVPSPHGDLNAFLISDVVSPVEVVRSYNFKDFQAKMQTKQAAPIVRAIRRFMQQVTADGAPTVLSHRELHSFTDALYNEMVRTPLWLGASQEELDGVRDGLEKYLVTKLYSKCFPLHTQQDAAYERKLEECARRVDPRTMDVPEGIEQQRAWGEAVMHLLSVNEFKTPRDKLICVMNACKMVMQAIKGVKTLGACSVSADDFLPSFLHLVLVAQVPNFVSNVRFMENYRTPCRLQSEEGYFLTSAVSAVQYWMTYDVDEAKSPKRALVTAVAIPTTEKTTNETEKTATLSTTTTQQQPQRPRAMTADWEELFSTNFLERAPPPAVSMSSTTNSTAAPSGTASPARPCSHTTSEQQCRTLDALAGPGQLTIDLVPVLWEQYRRLRDLERLGQLAYAAVDSAPNSRSDTPE